MFEIYDVIWPLYTPQVNSSAPFHFAHGDLSTANLIVDPESGEITGFIDWEMAGFIILPSWSLDANTRQVSSSSNENMGVNPTDLLKHTYKESELSKVDFNLHQMRHPCTNIGVFKLRIKY